LLLAPILLVIGVLLLINRPQPPPPPGAELARLLLLLDRIPSPEVAEKRHRELLQALRSLPTIAPVNGILAKPIVEGVGTGVVSIGGLLIGVGLVLVFWGLWKHDRKGLMFGALGTLISVGGVTLVSLRELNLQFVLPWATPIEAQSSPVTTMIPFGGIGPFVPGRGSELTATGRDSLRIVSMAVHDSTVDKQLLVLFVVGSADKRELSRRVARSYGSNSGLAQARADVVRDTILKYLDPDGHQSEHVIATIRGPSVTRQNARLDELDADRRVLVYGLWAKAATPRPKK